MAPGQQQQMAAGLSQMANILQIAEVQSVLSETCWIYSCCCVGYGCADPTKNCIWGEQKCLCMRSSVSSNEEVCGPLGCVSLLQKQFCCIVEETCPPKECRVGLCGIFCVGGQPDIPGIMSSHEAQSLSFFHDTCWLLYCCCYGYGCTRCADPLCKGRSKICCLVQDMETAECCGDEGCMFQVSKCTCVIAQMQCPCPMTPGIGCCGVLCCGGNLDQAPQAIPTSGFQQPQQVQMPIQQGFQPGMQQPMMVQTAVQQPMMVQAPVQQPVMVMMAPSAPP